MRRSIVTAGIGVLAGVLTVVLPIEAMAGRGYAGAGVRASFHRPVVPGFHRTVIRAPLRPAFALPSRFSRAPAGATAIAGFHGLAFRHRRDRFMPIAGVNGPYYDPAYGPVAVDPGSDMVASAPACRAQDYVVPSEQGEDRRVRVLRCY